MATEESAEHAGEAAEAPAETEAGQETGMQRLVADLHERAQRRARDEGVRRGAGGALLGHRPVHSGSRFSKNAVTPSMASSVESSIVSCERR